MKLTTLALSAMAVTAASVSAHPVAVRAIDSALIPDLGNSHSSGDCPPSRSDFINALTANIAAGHAEMNPAVAITFPTDDSPVSQLARLDAAAATLLNLFGPADGCPLASTMLPAQMQALRGRLAPRARTPAAPAKPAKPASATPPAKPVKTAHAQPAPMKAAPMSVPPRTGGKSRLPPGTASSSAPPGVDPKLVPNLGVARGVGSDGAGHCRGAGNAAIPCGCPPSRAEFLAALNANVAAGHAVKNPAAKVAFPTGTSRADERARVGALLVTLQNMQGPGVGCPVASTTFGQLPQ